MRQRIGLLLGPAFVVLIIWMGAPDSLTAYASTPQKAAGAWLVFALLLLMAIWWVTEAVPIPVTALLPMIVLPLTGLQTLKMTAADYMHPIVVLLLGGFIIAKAIERWQLHKRLALGVVLSVGERPTLLIGSFMAAGALMSMWVSNTATTLMLTPIAVSVARTLAGDRANAGDFAAALLLGIAWSCSIGGLGTPIGTPTNLIVMGYLQDSAGIEISFRQWMMIGAPTVCLLIPVGWVVLTRIVFRVADAGTSAGRLVVRGEYQALGALSVPEKRVIGVFVVVAGLWTGGDALRSFDWGGGFNPFSGLSDSVTALIGVLLCFLVPAGTGDKANPRLLDWKTAEDIPWGTLLLFGGGLALATAIRGSGLAGWFGGELSVIASLPTVLLLLVVSLFVIFVTEVTSNVATAASLMPILGAAAIVAGVPIEMMAVPIALSASCAFMLPMATGPNAVVYASGVLTIPQMARAGLLFNLLASVVITFVAYVVAPRVI